MKINGETQIICFFGATYKSSKMYEMYNRAFQKLNLNYMYIPAVVNDLESAVIGIKHLGFKAIGVTVPYKVAIIPYLDELDKQAQRIGAVNVVVNRNGKLIGSNTDGIGCVQALEEQTKVRNKNILLIGAGGAAQAIAFALIDSGAKLTIMNRTYNTAIELAKRAGASYVMKENLDSIITDIDIIINATTVGMSPNTTNSLIPKQLLQKKHIVMDIIANPKETKLLHEAKQAGCKVIYGNRMLFWQGVTKFKIYTDIDAPIETMEEIFI
jgi:shikimate dehydrogenase